MLEGTLRHGFSMVPSYPWVRVSIAQHVEVFNVDKFPPNSQVLSVMIEPYLAAMRVGANEEWPVAVDSRSKVAMFLAEGTPLRAYIDEATRDQ